MKLITKIVLILIAVIFLTGVTGINAEKVTITPEKFKTSYGSGEYFKTKVTDTDTKKPLGNVKVTLKVYTGNKYKKITLKSDKKGIVKYSASSLKAGNHKVHLTAKNAHKKSGMIKITKAKLTVKTSGNLKISVKNKQTGKAMGNIKVLVKSFSGSKLKTYTVKTARNGIAKVKLGNPEKILINIKETSNIHASSVKITKSMIKLKVNGKTFNVKLANNKATKELVKKLKKGSVKVKAHDYGGFEKVGSLGFSLPEDDKYITAKAGDIVLYNGDEISLFYNSNSWDYTRLGKIENVNDLKKALGKGSVTFTLSLK